MESAPISVLGILVKPLQLLADSFRRYQESKKIKEQLFKALSDELNNFGFHFNEITELGERRLFPLLKDGAEQLSISQINEFAQSIADLYALCAKLLESFVKIVNGCYEVSLNDAFMEHLRKTSGFLYDFVINMKNMRESNDRIKIDSRLYRFIMLYQDEIFKGFKEDSLGKTAEEIKKYMDVARNKIKPAFNKRTIRRDTLKKLRKSLVKFIQASKKVKIDRTLLKDLKKCTPPKFLALMVLIDEFKVLESEQAQ
jgi:hypothetical protein